MEGGEVRDEDLLLRHTETLGVKALKYPYTRSHEYLSNGLQVERKLISRLKKHAITENKTLQVSETL